jgi:hypothetical protein
MKRPFQWIVTALLIVFLIFTFYAIFNVGNPRSFFRLIVSDPSYDTAITLSLAVTTGLIAMVLYAGRMQAQSPIKHLLEINTDYIRELRKEGKSDEYIAESFLKEMGSKRGFVHSLAKRKVLKYLSKL